MEKIELIKSLSSKILRNYEIENLYVFGSFSKMIKPRDIDLLILYSKSNISRNQLNQLKINLSKSIKNKFGLSADFVTLTVNEEQQLNFIISEECIALT